MVPPASALVGYAGALHVDFRSAAADVDFRSAAADVGPSGDGPLILFVHGAMDRGTSFARLRLSIGSSIGSSGGSSGGSSTLTYDRRGYANSVRARPARSFSDHTADLIELVDVATADSVTGRDRACIIVGHSYGGDLAIAAAEQRPETVAGIVVFEAPMPWTPWWPDRRAGGGTLAIGHDAGPAAAAEAFMRRIVGDRVWERLGEATRDARRAEGAALLIDLGGLREGGRPFDPGRVRCPVAVAYGSESASHQRRSAYEAVVSLAQCRPTLHAIRGAGHGAHLSHAGELAEVVRVVVQRVMTAKNA